MGREEERVNEVRAQEIREMRELREWLAKYRDVDYEKSATFRSNELGGHMELKKHEDAHLIGPSREAVQRLLKSCGKKLGIDYVVR